MSVPIQQVMMPLQVAIGALLTKSVGSLYRVRDVREAPVLIQKNVKHRESVIMAAATLFSLATQGILNINQISNAIARSPIARYAILFQSALMALALCLAELTGRYMTPPLDWHDVEAKEVHNRNESQGKEKIMNISSSQASLKAMIPDFYSMKDYSAQSKAGNILNASTYKAIDSTIAFGQAPPAQLRMSGSVGVPANDKVGKLLNRIG